MLNKSVIETLDEQYQAQPEIRLFIEAIAVFSGLPIGTIFETFVSTKAKELATARMRSFYNELNDGEIELTDELINNDSFLHSYFAVVNYVIRSKDDKKAARFAKIIKSLYKSDIYIDQFEDYTSIFNELSDREFIILCIKREYELRANSVNETNENNPKSPFAITSSYWEEFIKEVQGTLHIEEKELEALLIRLQRTGCYMIHVGYWDIKNDGNGDTTLLFQKLHKIVSNL